MKQSIKIFRIIGLFLLIITNTFCSFMSFFEMKDSLDSYKVSSIWGKESFLQMFYITRFLFIFCILYAVISVMLIIVLIVSKKDMPNIFNATFMIPGFCISLLFGFDVSVFYGRFESIMLIVLPIVTIISVIISTIIKNDLSKYISVFLISSTMVECILGTTGRAEYTYPIIILGLTSLVLSCISLLFKDKIKEENEKRNTVDNVTLTNISSADQLLKFKELLDTGIITQEEFDKKKKELL